MRLARWGAVAAAILLATPANAAEQCAAPEGFPNPALVATMQRGVNLPNWDHPDPAMRPTVEQLRALRVEGFTHIRLPVERPPLADGEEQQQFAQALFEQIILLRSLDYTVSIDLHAGHLAEPYLNQGPEAARKFLSGIWRRLAPVVRLFNHAYYRRVPSSGRTVVRRIGDFFFPLDKIHDWNRLYGKRGFHQFQCVVPLDAVDALRDMLETIASSGLASPLAVLKRMGPGRAGYLSFPMEGYTLAVDFPNRAEARELIRRLEDSAADAGGRLYFAKDSLAQGQKIRAMYPDLPDWQEEVAKADPTGALMTDLVRRLSLRSAA